MVVVAAGFLDVGGGDLAAFQKVVKAFLDGALHRGRRDVVFLVVLHLFGPAVIGDGDERLHALGDGVGKEDDFAIDVARGAASGLD